MSLSYVIKYISLFLFEIQQSLPAISPSVRSKFLWGGGGGGRGGGWEGGNSERCLKWGGGVIEKSFQKHLKIRGG